MDIQRMQTNMTEAWIAKVVSDNPAVLLESGNVRLPPCRLSFAYVAEPAEDRKSANGTIIKGKYGASLLFTPQADLTAARDARMAMMRTAFPKNPDGVGFDDPIKDQADKVAPSEGGKNKKGATTAGYVPGCSYISANANLDYKPTLNEFVGGAVQPCFGTVEELKAKFYSGCWVIPTVSVFHGRSSENPNIFFGLSSLLKIADDQRFSGGGGDGVEAYAGVNIDLAGVDPKSLF